MKSLFRTIRICRHITYGFTTIIYFSINCYFPHVLLILTIISVLLFILIAIGKLHFARARFYLSLVVYK